MIIQVEPHIDGQVTDALLAVLGSPWPNTKMAIAVDPDIDIYDYRDVHYALATRVDPSRHVITIGNARGFIFDPSAQPVLDAFPHTAETRFPPMVGKWGSTPPSPSPTGPPSGRITNAPGPSPGAACSSPITWIRSFSSRRGHSHAEGARSRTGSLLSRSGLPLSHPQHEPPARPPDGADRRPSPPGGSAGGWPSRFLEIRRAELRNEDRTYERSGTGDLRRQTWRIPNGSCATISTCISHSSGPSPASVRGAGGAATVEGDVFMIAAVSPV